MQFNYPEGATPLTYDEIFNLIPNHITTQSELDEFEQFNILKAEQWAFNIRRKKVLTLEFAKKLHYKMFDCTWKWAGNFRQRQTNIGCSSNEIPIRLKMLFDDIELQIAINSYPIREIGVRFHHRLVYIHPFPNGNGRFSRMFADLLMYLNDESRFRWGRGDLIRESDMRKRYLEALREADKGNYEKLISFVDS